MGAFHSAIQSTTTGDLTLPHPVSPIREPWKEVFWSEVATVARALLAEQDLDDQNFTMQEWLDLRILTISGNSPCSLIFFTFLAGRYRLSSRRNVFPLSTYPPSQLPPRIHQTLIYIHPSHSTTSACPAASLVRPPSFLREPDCRPFEESAANLRITKRHPRIRQGQSLRQSSVCAPATHPRWDGEEEGSFAHRRSPQPIGDGDDGRGGPLRGHRRREELLHCGLHVAKCHGSVDDVLR